ncbi:MAG: hypothetical protein DRJ07_05895, partial [Bacteroidetes bacterium]
KIKIAHFTPAKSFPYYENEKWGYANKGGEVIISCQYDDCGFFSEGFAWVKKGEKFGIINKEGVQIIDFKYDGAGKFHEGFFPVKRDFLWGFIDSTGKQLLPFLFEDYTFQDDKTIHVKQNHQWGIVDRNGKHIVQPIYNRDFQYENGLAIVKRRREFGVIDKTGKELIDCKYDYIEKVNDSLFIVGIYKSYDNHYFGLSNISGDIKIPVEYKSIKNVVGQAVIAQDNRAFGLLSFNNDTIIDFDYTDLKTGNTNLLAAHKTGAYGFVDLQNNNIIPFNYREAQAFKNKFAIVTSLANYSNSGVINSKNEIIIPFEFQRIIQVDNKVFRVWDGNLYGFYNDAGKQLTEIEFDELDYHSYEDYRGDRDEQMEFGVFVNGYAIVGKKGRVGMINTDGKIVVPLKYHHLTHFDRNGVAVANFKDRKALINKKGKELTELKYDIIKLDELHGYYYAEKKFPYTKYEQTYYNEVHVGYFDFDGFYYGRSQYDSIHYKSEKEIIADIREEYKKIMSSNKSRKYEPRTLEKGIAGSYSEERFIVNDKSKNVRYEYYYDWELNRYGPFFIFIIDKSTGTKNENRYYYQHGKIVRWVGDEEKLIPISDALYCPEEENHLRARQHLILFNNSKVLKNGTNNARVKEIDLLCEKILEDISKDRYKKGDHYESFMGGAGSIRENYIDENGNDIYDELQEIDEGGGTMTEIFYKNGKKIRELTDGNYSEITDDDIKVGWFPVTYNLTTYYYEGDQFRSYKSNAGINEIEDFN